MTNELRAGQHIGSWLVSLALLVGAGLAKAAATPPSTDFSTSHAHEVVRIVDGDTVVLLLDGKSTTVRLIGVDTPETVHRQKPVEAYGKEAVPHKPPARRVRLR